MSRSSAGEEKCEPNLTPMLDMVFQLITFFVLIFNCKQAELASNVDLPIVGSAKPIAKYGGKEIRVIVFNFKFEDPKEGVLSAPKRSRPAQLWVMGTLVPEDQIYGFVQREAQSSMMAQGLTEDDIKNGKELTDYIVIRADKDIPCKMVSNVFIACQKYGFRQFAFRSWKPD